MMIYILWVFELLLGLKIFMNFLIPYEMLIKSMKGEQGSISIGLLVDLILLLFVLIFNILTFFLVKEISFYDKYSFFIFLSLVFLSYVHLYIMVYFFGKLINKK
jgi:hypothetical protein